MPDFPPDMEIGVNGLGVFQNGTARDVTEEEEWGYFNNFGVPPATGMADTENIKTSGTPTVKDSDFPDPTDTTPYTPPPDVPVTEDVPATETDDSATAGSSSGGGK
jgi:hypothetical protein